MRCRAINPLHWAQSIFFIDIKTLSPAIRVSEAAILDPDRKTKLELSEITILLDLLPALSRRFEHAVFAGRKGGFQRGN